MTHVAKMSFVDCKCEIENFQEYVTNIADELLKENESFNYEIIESKEDFIKYGLLQNKHDLCYLAFKKIPVEDIIQMHVDIYDKEENLDQEFLENVKFSIVKLEKRKWDKILWLFDIQSERLSSELYNMIYRVENEFRHLINEVMIQNYGLEWWENFVPYSVKNKHNARRIGYKKAVPAFAAIDERLLSIDIGDLIDIITVNRKQLPYIILPIDVNEEDPDEKVELVLEKNTVEYLNRILNEDTNVSIGELIHMLNKSAKVTADLWKENFSDLLPEDFIEKFKKFELARNNIAHNKPIDRTYYNGIKNEIFELTNIIEMALNKL